METKKHSEAKTKKDNREKCRMENGKTIQSLME
jgi:hypothetical protein